MNPWIWFYHLFGLFRNQENDGSYNGREQCSPAVQTQDKEGLHNKVSLSSTFMPSTMGFSAKVVQN